jgi:zinc protease
MRARWGSRRLSFLVLTLGTLLWGAVPTAGAAPAKPVTVRTLANGLSMIYEQDPSSPLTVICLLVRGGQRSEPEGQAGLAFLMTRLLLEIPDAQSAQFLMRQSSSAGMTCRGDFSLICLESLSTSFEDTLRIMAEPLLHPLFTGIRLERIKDSMLHSKEISADDSVFAGRAEQARALFGDIGYGASAYGNPESLKAVSAKQVTQYYRTHFQTGNVVLSVVTDLAEEKVAGLIEKYLKDFPAGEAAALPALKPFPVLGPRSYLAKKTVQTFLSLGFRLPGLSPRSYALASLAENLLGNGVASRLWPLRQQERLAYNLGAQAMLFKDAGLLEVYLEADEAKKDAALAGLTSIIKDVWTNGVPDDELAVLKIMTRADLLRDNETNDNRGTNLAFWAAMGLGPNFLDRLQAEIEAVTLAEFNDYLRAQLDPDKAHLVIVGPADVGGQGWAR